MHGAVALGVVAATAVLTGALLVGDSMQGSLRSLAIERLGRVDEMLLSDQPFRAALAREVASRSAFQAHYTAAVPVWLLRGTVEKPDYDAPARANQVTLIGSTAHFWRLGDQQPARLPQRDEVVLNQPLADDLGAKVGDELLVRIPLAGDVPSESLLGKKTETLASRRLKLVAIVPPRGLGSFSLRPNQQLPRNAYLPLEVVQDVLDEPGKVNALLVAGRNAARPAPPSASAALQAALDPQPSDYGLSIDEVRIGGEANPAAHYFNITSERMFLPAPVVAAAQRAFGEEGLQPTVTYLANTIRAGGKTIPYSTVTGLQPTAELGPVFGPAGEPLTIGEHEIILNRWAADDLGAEPGDSIALSYYEPVSTHGELVEPPPVTFRLKAIVPLQSADSTPTAASDPHFTPELKGVTDQASIDDWDLPFELVEEIRDQDEQYWDDYRTTPKAFISLAAARRLWASRFGDTTSLRIPYRAGRTAASIFAELELDPAQLGLVFRPVKREALAAAQGTTPFGVLFLLFSMFIIAAAAMLTLLLFRLAVELRASELGLLAAVGLRRRQIAGIFLGEAFAVALLGALVGVAVGVGYAGLLLAGLSTWWLDAITTPFLRLHVRAGSLLAGLLSGVLVALLTTSLSLRKLVRLPLRRLLAGDASETATLAGKGGGRARHVGRGLLILALATAIAALWLRNEAQIGAFFGSGAMVLAAILLLLWSRFRSGPRSTAEPAANFGLRRLAARNAARNPSRSTLTIGLVAAASFLVIAVSAFRLAPTQAGTGGFELVAESDQPLLHSLNSPSGRFELGFSSDDEKRLAACQTYALRVHAGEDASCLNLYRPSQPRVLGLPAALVERGGFEWAQSAATTPTEQANPWRLLEKPLGGDVVPVVLDLNTAMYSLHLWSGVGETFTIQDGQGRPLTLQVVGLLKNSMLQGEVLMSEADFLRHFPESQGYRFFLVDVPQAQSVAAVQRSLESTLGDWGFDAVRATDRLQAFLAVQNSYLSTFQSLGALGLLLGTFGLATVQLRNVFERRGELALLRATGFRRRRLAGLVLLENALLLVAGLAVGLIAALVAVLPHLVLGGAKVPWQPLAVMLAVVLVVGLLAGLLAVRATLRAPLIPALRGK